MSLDLNSPAVGAALFATANALMISALKYKSSSTRGGHNAKAATPARVEQPPKLTLPVIDFNKFTNKDADLEGYILECKKAAEAFRAYGVCVVRDPRVNEEHNNRFGIQGYC